MTEPGKQNEPKNPYAKVQRPTPPHAGRGGVSSRNQAEQSGSIGETTPGGTGTGGDGAGENSTGSQRNEGR